MLPGIRQRSRRGLDIVGNQTSEAQPEVCQHRLDTEYFQDDIVGECVDCHWDWHQLSRTLHRAHTLLRAGRLSVNATGALGSDASDDAMRGDAEGTADPMPDDGHAFEHGKVRHLLLWQSDQ
jgi:hypothetical protein